METNLAYKEPRREELIGGEAVLMAPRPSWNHNRIAFHIAVLFEGYLKGKPCTAIAGGTDLYLTDKDRFIPDVMIVCDRDKIKWNGVHGAPDLVVEVLSPSTARNDKSYKKEAYAKAGVREYWIVSPGEKSVEVYHASDGGFVLHDIYTLVPAYMLEAMSEAERSEVVMRFKCSLYDDFEIALEDIFTGLLP